MIQLGFTHELNYAFVVQNAVASSQIFHFLPQGLENGLDIDLSRIVMHSLIPLNTTSQLNYVTTLARAYIPNTMVDSLRLKMHVPTDPLWNSDDASVRQLMDYVNTGIPIDIGEGLPSIEGIDNDESRPNSNENNAFESNTNQNQSASKMGTTIGAIVGGIGGAAAYGVAMFFIARRYKQRKQRNRRSSSATPTPEMQYNASPAMVGGQSPGAIGVASTPGGFDGQSRDDPFADQHSQNSGPGHVSPQPGRNHQISPPMATENSLGWN